MMGGRMAQRLFILTCCWKKCSSNCSFGHQTLCCLCLCNLPSCLPFVPSAAVTKLKNFSCPTEGKDWIFVGSGVWFWFCFYFNSIFPSWPVECISTDGHGVSNAVSGFLISLTNFMIIAAHVHSTFPLTSTGRVECAKNVILHSADVTLAVQTNNGILATCSGL